MNFEVRRVAAALGCANWFEVNGSQFERRFEGVTASGRKVNWWVSYYPAVEGIGFCEKRHAIHREAFGQIGPWHVGKKLDSEEATFLARTLYCLGVEEQGVWDELKNPLTAHDKIELRLTLPQEFWPSLWREEL